jgi:hypothetical protein
MNPSISRFMGHTTNFCATEKIAALDGTVHKTAHAYFMYVSKNAMTLVDVKPTWERECADDPN